MAVQVRGIIRVSAGARDSPCPTACQTPPDNRTYVRIEPRGERRPRHWKEVIEMLSRRQRIWDEALADLGIDPRDIEVDARPATSLAAWRRIARHLEARAEVREAAEAWDWAVSEALRADVIAGGEGEAALWEASAFFERHEAIGSLRATLEQAWAALRSGTPVPADFARRLMERLAGVYELMRMPERAAEAHARAAIMAALAEPAAPEGVTVRRCA